MSIELKPHNIETYEKIENKLEQSKKVAVIQPPGTGKSYLALKLLEENKGKKAVYVAPSNPILHNLKRTIFDSGMNMTDFPDLTRITYAKLMRMSEEEISQLGADIIILDEFHHCGAPEWGNGVNRLLEKNPESIVLGLSATPIRYLDNGRDMAEELFGGNVASEMSLEEAIDRGILPEATYVSALYSYNDQLQQMQEEINNISDGNMRSEAQTLFQELKGSLDENTQQLPELLSQYMTNKSGKYIVFCKTIEDMKAKQEAAQEMFSSVNPNITTYSVHSQIRENNKILSEFEQADDDSLKLMFAVDMLNEGYHIKDLDGVVMMRPTFSPTVFEQQIGRALSVKSNSGNPPVILDLVNNFDSCKIIEDFCERMKQYGKGTGKKHVSTKSRLTIFDKTKQFREIASKIIELCPKRWLTIDEKIQQLVEWNRKYPRLPMAGIKGNEIKNIIESYSNSEDEHESLRKEYLRMLSYYDYIRTKKSHGQLTPEQEEICREGNVRGIFGISTKQSGLIQELALKYRINEEKVKYILDKYSSMESFIKAFRERTLDKEDEKLFEHNLNMYFDINGGTNRVYAQLLREIYRQEYGDKTKTGDKELIIFDKEEIKKMLDRNNKPFNIVAMKFGVGKYEKEREKSYKEIAELDGTTTSNISALYRNGFRKIRRVVEYAIKYKAVPTSSELMKKEEYTQDEKQRIEQIYDIIFDSNLIFYPDEEFEQEPDSITSEEMSELLAELSRISKYADIRNKGQQNSEITEENLNEDDREFYLKRRKMEIESFSIETLMLDTRAYNGLGRSNVKTLGELLEKSEDELMEMRNLGRKSVDAILQKIEPFREELEKIKEELTEISKKEQQSSETAEVVQIQEEEQYSEKRAEELSEESSVSTVEESKQQMTEEPESVQEENEVEEEAPKITDTELEKLKATRDSLEQEIEQIRAKVLEAEKLLASYDALLNGKDLDKKVPTEPRGE